MALETLLISAVLPAALDLFKNGMAAITRKWVGLSVDDQLKLQAADIERLKALAALDNPYGTPSAWVVDLRGAFRYVAAALLIVGGLCVVAFGVSYGNVEAIAIGMETAGAPFAFIFGERLWGHMTNRIRQ